MSIIITFSRSTYDPLELKIVRIAQLVFVIIIIIFSPEVYMIPQALETIRRVVFVLELAVLVLGQLCECASKCNSVISLRAY